MTKLIVAFRSFANAPNNGVVVLDQHDFTLVNRYLSRSIRTVITI
jgi:hypothetical protein